MINIDNYKQSFAEIDNDKDAMLQTLIKYSSINTGSYNTKGITDFIALLEQDFSQLNADNMQRHSLPSFKFLNKQHQVEQKSVANALSLSKRAELKQSVLLSAHLDTVFSKESPFQEVSMLDKGRIRGPGVADIKGGIVIILFALKHFESSKRASSLGWEVLFNPDEEIGSPASKSLIQSVALKHQLGLVFEPCLENNALVSHRKGSLNLSILCKGKSAHAGRYFHEGKSAIASLAKLIHLFQTRYTDPESTVNFGTILGGENNNTVPELAQCKVNIRSFDSKQLALNIKHFEAIKELVEKEDGVSITLLEETKRLPKTISKDSQRLIEGIEEVYQALNLPISWQESGGVCDGNTLAEVGLANIDTLGVRGGKIHTEEEFCFIDSLAEKVKVLFILLSEISNNNLNLTT
ncbi:MAG: hydrolase [Chlamydiales bacterium]|nr:hydrolase [Chlamydiales bacterium]